MICQECGSHLAPAVRFCTSCGLRVSGDSTPLKVEPVALEAEPPRLAVEPAARQPEPKAPAVAPVPTIPGAGQDGGASQNVAPAGNSRATPFPPPPSDPLPKRPSGSSPPPVVHSRRTRGLVLVAILVVSAAVVVGMLLGRRGSQPVLATPAHPVTPTSPSSAEAITPPSLPTVPPPAPVDPEITAAATLQNQRAEDLARVSITGMWAAQLASKYDGITDPDQLTSAGTHVFRNTDILTETQRLRSENPSSVSTALLLSTDYGNKHTFQGHVLWVTFAIGSFSSSAEVTSWCSSRFPQLSGKVLLNQCAARQLDPPS